jgi:hypothetical protein
MAHASLRQIHRQAVILLRYTTRYNEPPRSPLCWAAAEQEEQQNPHRPDLLPPSNELNAVALISEAAWVIEDSPAIVLALLPAYRRAASFLRDLDSRHHALRGDEQVELFELFDA